MDPRAGTKGILNPADGFTHFRLERHAPSADLAAFVEWHWIVRWDLEGEPPFTQEVLPHPNVNLAVQATGSAVHGVTAGRFVATLEGRGRVVASKFTPGGFLPFARGPMTELMERVVPVVEAFGEAGRALEFEAHRDASDGRIIETLESFLRSFSPKADASLERVNALVALAQSNRAVTCVDDLAREAAMSSRTLHRLFERYLGVGPKWVIRRSRVQEAADRVASGAKVEWAALAHELGYHDQAHLIHDFKEQIGFTPAAYAAKCAAAATRR